MDFVEKKMAAILNRTWWVLLLRALAAIAFGLLTWLQPGISLATLVFLFSAYATADGILAVWTAIAGRKENEGWIVLLLGGVVGIAIGVLTFSAPGVTALVLQFYIAIWAVASGVLQIAAAIRLRNEIEGEWWLILGGLASVLFGVLLIAQPAAGALALLWLIAAFAFVYGVLLVLLAFKARTFGKQAARS